MSADPRTWKVDKDSPGEAVNTYTGGQTWGTSGRSAKNYNPFDTSKSNELAGDASRNAQEQYDRSQPILGAMNEADTKYKGMYDKSATEYKGARDAYVNDYLQGSARLRQEASDQGTNAQKTYTNDIQPKLKANMEAAMTLQQAGDVNNSVHTGVRGLYNKQGQKARTQGLQDFGVLSALGAQAAGQQFGSGTPMTAGMQGQIYAQNQSQAGNAYAKAQQRMHDLEQQGIDRGFTESAAQYDRGQQAIGNFIGAEGEYLNRGRDTRGELAGYDADRLGVQTGRAGEDMDLAMGGAGLGRDIVYNKGERDLGALGQYYGTQGSIIAGRQEEEQGRRAGMGQLYGSLIGAASKYAGAA